MKLGSLKEGGRDGTLIVVSRDLTKATVALTAAAGRGPYSRPEMRLFYTYAKWNDAAKGWVASNTVYANNTSGSSVGIQAETWW